MKRNGFTVVELLVSFTLSLVVMIFLFQALISLKELYVETGIKTEMFNKQGLISKKINDDFKNSGISAIKYFCTNVDTGGSPCYTIVLKNGDEKILYVNNIDRKLTYDDYVTVFPKGTKFDNISINSFNFLTGNYNNGDLVCDDNSANCTSTLVENDIIRIKISIVNKKTTGINYDVVSVYRNVEQSDFLYMRYHLDNQVIGSISPRKLTAGANVQLDSGSNISKNDYILIGWRDANNNTYALGETINNVNENLNLYPIWDLGVARATYTYNSDTVNVIYDDLQEAIEAVGTNTSTITLLQDISIANPPSDTYIPFCIGGTSSSAGCSASQNQNITLDLHNHKISSGTSIQLINVLANSKLKIINSSSGTNTAEINNIRPEGSSLTQITKFAIESSGDLELDNIIVNADYRGVKSASGAISVKNSNIDAAYVNAGMALQITSNNQGNVVEIQNSNINGGYVAVHCSSNCPGVDIDESKITSVVKAVLLDVGSATIKNSTVEVETTSEKYKDAITNIFAIGSSQNNTKPVNVENTIINATSSKSGVSVMGIHTVDCNATLKGTTKITVSSPERAWGIAQEQVGQESALAISVEGSTKITATSTKTASDYVPAAAGIMVNNTNGLTLKTSSPYPSLTVKDSVNISATSDGSDSKAYGVAVKNYTGNVSISSSATVSGKDGATYNY